MFLLCMEMIKKINRLLVLTFIPTLPIMRKFWYLVGDEATPGKLSSFFLLPVI